MPYAINLLDWLKFKDDIGLKIILTPVTSQDSEVVECEPGRVDSLGVRLQCDDERGRAIVHLIRQNYQKHVLRCYHSKSGKGGWQRV